jgi:hypothetical protein
MKLASFDCPVPYVVFHHYGKEDNTRFELGACFSIAMSNSKTLVAGTGGSPVFISFV